MGTMMELKELSEQTMRIFEIADIQELGNALMVCVTENHTEKMFAFCNLVDNDLQKDWLQMIYQYYYADRAEKKQDYTPKTLAQFLSRLIGESKETIDMCAGSGALAIQRWVECPETTFLLYEIDENVIPFLLFNMAVRNITAKVYQSDVLQAETTRAWKIAKGERFGKVISL